MSGRTKATRPRAETGNPSVPATPLSSGDRVSYIRAFRVRDWVRAACELRPLGGLPAASISRQRRQRPL